MPRVNKLVKADKRETDLMGEIARLQAMSGLSFRELCKRANVDYSTFMKHRKHPRSMRYGELWAFKDACEKEIGGEI